MNELRYVVLRHEGIADPHFDVMIEIAPGGALATWRSPRWPMSERTQLVQLGEHRREYLDYEGPVSGNRGTVHRVAQGPCRIDRRSDDAWQVTLLDPTPHVLILTRKAETAWTGELE
jgi:hypothetical protein